MARTPPVKIGSLRISYKSVISALQRMLINPSFSQSVNSILTDF